MRHGYLPDGIPVTYHFSIQILPGQFSLDHDGECGEKIGISNAGILAVAWPYGSLPGMHKQVQG